VRRSTRSPPDIDAPTARDLWDLVRAGRRLRALGRRNAYRLLRWAPMPAADFADEWFETDLLRAAVVAPGLSGTMLGPRSAGSTLVLLWREALPPRDAGIGAARGGPGALTAAMAAAARAEGAEIRTGARVERIVVHDGRVTGLVADGREWPAPRVVSAIDPKTTFLRLVDPLALPPSFMSGIHHYRARGTLAKVNLALAAMPAFRGVAPDGLAGRIHVGPGLDYLEQAFDAAKYGEVSSDPWLDVRLPSVADASLAPPGAHVASIYVHYAPCALRQGTWDAGAREALLASVLATIERYARGFRQIVVAAQVLTPADLERDYGYWGGHVYHGELALDQLFTMRPLLGHARYRTPVEGLWLCGAGTHPGGFMSGTNGRLAATALGRTDRA
jgi:phytoene dehydrogenase-like protein